MGTTTLSRVTLIILICEIIYGKKLSLPNSNNLGTKINECQRCNVLTDSVSYWLDKTSRGKFEGGDAAWEETKLKSYSRSEIRLVEVQEGLCSELKKHQDQCYALAEEAEQVIEKWWFHEDPITTDLYSWLCIDTLKNCCPKGHFGEFCSPCPLHQNSKICGGNGKCDGDGTRMGNGSCKCRRGYSGDYCDQCAKDFYSENGKCESCHRACDGCSGEGPQSCEQCKQGWSKQSGICADIDECLEASICNVGEYCVNREGAYTCKSCDESCKTCLGAGPSNCTMCNTDNVLWSGMCVDDQVRSNILKDTLKRTTLYIGLLVITIFIYRTSKHLASLIMILIAVYIYFSEKSSRISIIDVFLNLYFK